MSNSNQIVASVDLEPNADGSFDGVRDAMEWFDRTVPQGTIFATYLIAERMPELLQRLVDSHEIGIHVHPAEFGHEHDQLAKLPRQRQRELIATTREALAAAIDVDVDAISSFRAGRHSASSDTFDVLRDLGITVDASVHVRYDEYLPPEVTKKSSPFRLDGLLELPISYGHLPLVSRCGVRGLLERPVTATAATIRSDQLFCPGHKAVRAVLTNAPVGSVYMHPYDVSGYGDIRNAGQEYRRRCETLFDDTLTFVTAASLVENDWPEMQN